jgi:hypothetical protein
MGNDPVDPHLDKIRSHAIALKDEATRLLDDIDAGRLQEARYKAAQLEKIVYELGDLLSDQIERQRGRSSQG